jgi:DNA-directed RNA polymerase specialized sigma24 family protein
VTRVGDGRFDEIYRAHREDLFRLAVLICGDRTRGEDAVAEVFAKVLVRWRDGAVLERPQEYLRRALVNELTGGLQRQALERRVAARQWSDDRDNQQMRGVACSALSYSPAWWYRCSADGSARRSAALEHRATGPSHEAPGRQHGCLPRR